MVDIWWAGSHAIESISSSTKIDNKQNTGEDLDDEEEEGDSVKN